MYRNPEPRARAERYPARKRVLRYLVECGVITPYGRAGSGLDEILALRPRRLRVPKAAAQLSISQRTLSRLIQRSGLPSPRAWIGLARALHAHRAILAGRTLKDAAARAGYREQLTMSSALHRATGFRPSALRDIAWTDLVDAWIAYQRRRGALVRLSTDGRAISGAEVRRGGIHHIHWRVLRCDP